MMQKASYLQYFKKGRYLTKPNEQSFEKDDDIPYQGGQILKNLNIDSNLFQNKPDFPTTKMKDSIMMENLLLHNKSNKIQQVNKKISEIKSYKNERNFSQTVQRNMTELSQQIDEGKPQYILGKREIEIPQQNQKPQKMIKNSKLNKLLSQSLHSFHPRKQSQASKQMIKAIESLNKHNPDVQIKKLCVRPIKSYARNKTAPNKKCLKTSFGDLNSSCRNYNDFYTISLQNLRMGWRILNSRSMVKEYLTSDHFNYHLYNGNLINKKKSKIKNHKEKYRINPKQVKNIAKAFFNDNKFFKPKQKQIKNIFYCIKSKNYVQQYIQQQSRVKQGSKENLKQNQKFVINSKVYVQCQGDKKNANKQNRYKPSFFKSTYFEPDRSFNRRLCGKSKQKLVRDRAQIIPQRKNRFETSQSISKQDEDMKFFNSNEFQVIGKGSTIIEIRNIEINSNPQVKDQDILMLQVMNKSKQKGPKTPAMKYSSIRRGLKFAIDTRIGDFVPIKIWKYHGINALEFGIIDLNLLLFKDQKKYFYHQDYLNNFKKIRSGIQEIQIYKQEKQHTLTQKRRQRQILFYHSREKLRKSKKSEIQAQIQFDCLIYNKRFSTVRVDVDVKVDGDGDQKSYLDYNECLN